MNDLKEKMQKQYDLLSEECIRAKLFIIESGFDCTTAPWVIIHEYRNAIKHQLEILRINLYDEDS